MGVLNGQTANQDTFNNAFLDKNADTVMPNKITLSDPDEGGDIDSVQGSLNEIFDTQGTSEGDANAKVYANTNYIADGDSQKTAIEKLDAQAGTADGELTNHVADLTAHRNFDTLANLTTWAATADNGWFGFATDTKQSFQVIDGALEPIGGGGGLNYLGTWDASTNTPSLPIGDEENGDFYVVDVAGTQDIGNGSVDWAVGDWAIYNDLTGFLKIDNSELVSSVNGQTGAVVLDADDIAETTSRYWDVKNNRTATTNPTVTNDDSENYAQGSTWLNTSTGTMYVCTDASTGAAVWKIQSGSDSKNTRWGNINRNTISSSDWVTTGDAAVTDSSIDGSIQDSFRVDTGTAGNTAEIEHIIPPSAIDVRHNQAVIEYQLFDITDPVTCKVLDWDNNIIGQVELTQTGSAPAVADNIRFSHATVDFSFPFSHGSLIRSVKFRFECASDITAGQFLVNFIQSDSNPRSIGQWVEVNSVSLSGSNGGTYSANAAYNFSGTGIGWDSIANKYTAQKTGGEITFSTGVTTTAASADALSLYKNNVQWKRLETNAGVSKSNSITITDYVAGDEFYISSPTGTRTLVNNTTLHYLNITETANRRSIMSEVETSGLSYTPTFTGLGTVTDVDVRYNITENGYHIYGEATTGTPTAVEAQMSLPDNGIVDLTTSTNILGTFIRDASVAEKGGFVLGTDGDGFVNFSDSSVFSNATMNPTVSNVGSSIFLAGERFSFNFFVPIKGASTKQVISIPVDEIIADGNEYAVFGKFITVGGVKHQVYRRGFEGTVGTKAAGLPLTLKPVDNVWINQPTNNSFSNLIGVGTTNYVRVDYYYTGGSAGNLAVTQFGAYTGAGVHYYFDYYDTARPYYG